MTNFVVMPMTFLSGTFYLVDRLPEPFRTISHYNPFFYLIAGFRYGFIGQRRRLAAGRRRRRRRRSDRGPGAGLLVDVRHRLPAEDLIGRADPRIARPVLTLPRAGAKSLASQSPPPRGAGTFAFGRPPCPSTRPAFPKTIIMGVYNRAPLAFERGEGARLYSTEGEAYLDCVAGIATNGLGHAHPKLVEALKDQAEKLWHVSNIFRIPEQEALAARLCEATFADVVFFTNSGTEAVECALKTARKYHWANGEPGADRHHRLRRRLPRPQLRGGQRRRQSGLSRGLRPAPAGLSSACRSATWRRWRPPIGPTTAAVIIEPVQGEGGARALPRGPADRPARAVRRARRRC